MFSRKKISKTLKNVFSSMEYIWKPLNWGVGDVKFRGGRGGRKSEGCGPGVFPCNWSTVSCYSALPWHVSYSAC